MYVSYERPTSIRTSVRNPVLRTELPMCNTKQRYFLSAHFLLKLGPGVGAEVLAVFGTAEMMGYPESGSLPTVVVVKSVGTTMTPPGATVIVTLVARRSNVYLNKRSR